MSFGGQWGQPGSALQTTESDEALRLQTPMGLGTASEAGVGQGRTWGQDDVVIHGGSVWQKGVEVLQGSVIGEEMEREGRIG